MVFGAQALTSGKAYAEKYSSLIFNSQRLNQAIKAKIIETYKAGYIQNLNKMKKLANIKLIQLDYYGKSEGG
jgi:hypothetical protein